MELTLPENGAQAGAADAQPRTPLTSEQTGRQVAAAFGELSEAFAASRRRSFDEMAEEMLRPMLQDWLDNNLPHLVERLVREEIERIARG
jgi:cell pole-organizing protein PopZ